MEILRVRNPHQAIPELLDRLSGPFVAIERESRDGKVIMFPEPCTIVYAKPMERVVFWKERDANPFFHLFEVLWMLAGRRDVKFVAQFVKRMSSYSDDGKNFHAAYGYRWRKHFKVDQLSEIIKNLQENKNCRRQVLGIWDPKKDLGRTGLDLPCNLSVTFQVNHEDKLDMVVHNRSNDALLGATGANCVQFSVLQEYLSIGIGIPMGRYWQVSSNMHIYLRDYEKYKELADFAADPFRISCYCPYEDETVVTTPIIDTDLTTWNEDLKMWMRDPKKVGLRSQFFLRTATPMMMAHKAHKKGKTDQAVEIIQTQMIDGSDWKKASLEWLQRRKEKQDAT